MKNKNLIFTVAGVLLISGGAFAGTKAWLSDTKDVSNDLIITTGTFELAIDHSNPWLVTSQDNTEIKNKDDKNNFINVRPGDTFQKTIVIKNNGSLSQYLTVKNMNEFKSGTNIIDKDLFNITYEGLNQINNNRIAPEETKSITVKVSTKADIMEKDKHTNKTIDLIGLVPKITIEANQVNYNPISNQ